jgi:glucose-1-phosphate thymidylyltransferase
MKGVLICGGTGTRLKPLTDVTNKSLLPVYDRPLIEYPLDIMRKAGIREIAIVTGSENMGQITDYLGSGAKMGCSFAYKVQDTPAGIAQALGLAEEFAAGDDCCVILGDNVFFGDIAPVIHDFKGGAHLFLKELPDCQRFGVATLDGKKVTSIEEKPLKPKSNYAVTGCYVYDARCFEIIRNLKPSARGELEITDVSKWFVEQGEAQATILHDEWIDAGTFESLFRASELVRQRKLDLVKSATAKNVAAQKQKRAELLLKRK